MSSQQQQSGQQPLPRMTDSTTGPGTGPSSQKLAALSIESYHLDSPPFTGAAVGGPGPLAEAGARMAAMSTLNGNRSSAGGAGADDCSPNSGASTATGTRSNSNASRNRQKSHNSEHSSTSAAAAYDGDVPAWQLDEQRAGRSAATDNNTTSSSSGASASATKARSPSPLNRNKLVSPPPRSSATSPGISSSGGGPSRVEAVSARTLLSAAERQGRPAYTQTEDVDGFAEESSSHPADAYDEIEGDETLGSELPKGPVPVQGQRKEDYVFPRHRLPTRMRDDTKVPLVIVACGSFSPPTYLHLRIFEMAKDQVIEEGKYELLGGYYSPVSDYYTKEGLAKATHRVRMCELAVEKTSTWLMVDAWESLQDEYQRTAVVLDHFDKEINGGAEGGVLRADGTRARIRIMLLAGGDLIQSMGEPGVWADADLHHILGRYGCMIVERTGADVWSFLLSHDLLWKYRRNLSVVTQVIYDDVSSSKIRLFIRRGKSIRYLLPQPVVRYMAENQLYRLPPEETHPPPDADIDLP